jgi:hypothetical protein
VHVFSRRHVETYGVEPPADLRKAFNDVLNSVVSPGRARGGVA